MEISLVFTNLCVGSRVVFEAKDVLFAYKRLEAASLRPGLAENVKKMILKK